MSWISVSNSFAVENEEFLALFQPPFCRVSIVNEIFLRIKVSIMCEWPCCPLFLVAVYQYSFQFICHKLR